jgi:hypothetical protein
MDTQLYVRARKQEFRRELARRALVSEAKALRTQGNGDWRGTMFRTKEYVAAVTPTEEKEMRQETETTRSPAEVQQSGNGRAWRWQVEPGMESAFQDLLGWMLSSQQGAEVETAPPRPEPSAPAAAEHQPAPGPQPSARGVGEGRLTVEPGSLPA